MIRQLGSYAFQPARVDIGQYHVHPEGRGLAGERRADSTARAGDHRGPAVELLRQVCHVDSLSDRVVATRRVASKRLVRSP